MSEQPKDGGPAFSTVAGQALAGIMGLNPNLPGDFASYGAWPDPDELVRRRAQFAYLQADAMLAARGGEK